MALKTIELFCDTRMAGLAELTFSIDRDVLPAAVFRSMTSDTLCEAEIRRSNTLTHGLVALMMQVIHVIATHIPGLSHTVLQLRSLRPGQHFRKLTLGNTQARSHERARKEQHRKLF